MGLIFPNREHTAGFCCCEMTPMTLQSPHLLLHHLHGARLSPPSATLRLQLGDAERREDRGRERESEEREGGRKGDAEID